MFMLGVFWSLVMAGLLHFVLGFTFMNISISRIGVARTGSLLATSPLFAAVIAAVSLNELIGVPLMLGVVMVVSGVWFISSQPAQAKPVVLSPPAGGAGVVALAVAEDGIGGGGEGGRRLWPRSVGPSSRC